MFTCGFDRSNFSLPMTARLLVLAGVSTGGSGQYFVKLNLGRISVIRVQLEEPLPQFRDDLLQAGEVELANLALVAIAEATVLGGGTRAEQSLLQDLFEVANPEPGAGERFEELYRPAGGEGRRNCRLDR